MAVQEFEKIREITEGLQKTYTSAAGTDIVATIDGILIGNLNGISFSTTREKAPIYVMGSVDAVSFGRGKRGHAGSLIFTNFDRHALYDIMEGTYTQGAERDRYQYFKKTTDIPAGGRSVLLDEQINSLLDRQLEKATANYSDQIPPFTITLASMTEYGNVSAMHILGVELINEGSGVSIDDIVTETQMTFVARAILGWRPITDSRSKLSSSDVTDQINKLTAIQQARAYEYTVGGTFSQV